MTEDLKNAPPNSVVLLHACAHNPTGLDPTRAQCEALAQLVQEKHLFTFFDCAYQGFASGDIDKDAWPIRMFIQRGIEMLCSQSFAKNFGLYAERIGALHIICSSEKTANAARSQIKTIIRANYSNPPVHGALVVSIVLSDPTLFQEWVAELKLMSGRIHNMRQQLYETLKADDINWPHVMKQIGMFSYTGLTAKQVEVLTKKHHIFLTSDGRISLPGLSTKTVPILANAIKDVLHTANL